MKTMKFGMLIALTIISVQGFSQLQFGAQAGFGASTQSELGNISQNNHLCCGLNAGLLTRYQTNEWFALKSGLFFNQKGRQLKDENEKYRLNYLQLPVKAEFSAPVDADKNTRIFFATGPYVATCLKAESEKSGVETDIKAEVHKFDAGISMEIGLAVPVVKHKMLFSLGYDMGMTEVYKNREDFKNKNLSLNIGFLF